MDEHTDEVHASASTTAVDHHEPVAPAHTPAALAPVAPVQRVAHAVARPPEKKLPKRIRVSSLYGFYDEHNAYREWKEGFVTASEAEIKILVGRGAPIQVLEE